MNLLQIVLSFQLATLLALGQSTPQSAQASLPNQPDALVQSLYTQVVARHPHGIPEGADWNVFAPYFSEALLHRFDLAKACSADWDRSNPAPQLKAEMASTYGIFSGERGSAEPKSFEIQRTLPEKDGSSRVDVELTGPQPPPPYSERWTWRVAAVVIRENGQLAVDDVIYINDATDDNPKYKLADRRLSHYLSAGCNGPDWILHSLPNQPAVLVRGLYQQVVARKPLNIPYGEDWKTFAPYFSSTLMHGFDVYRACMDDWDRQNQDSRYILKPPGLIEFGIFSGSSEESNPTSFQIERAETEKDGSVRVYVRLRWEEPGDLLTWSVADILIREGGRLVVDDVIFLKDVKHEGPESVDVSLSKLLTDGCDGPHWVGYRDH